MLKPSILVAIVLILIVTVIQGQSLDRQMEINTTHNKVISQLINDIHELKARVRLLEEERQNSLLDIPVTVGYNGGINGGTSSP